MQEVILNKEVVFEIVNTKIDTKHKECQRCHKVKRNKCFSFNKVLKLDLCNMCNKSVGTNPFYNQNFGKSKNFVGIKNFSGQEKILIINKHQKSGMSYDKARKQVEIDLNVIKSIKPKKYEPEPPSASNLAIQKVRSELNKELIKGLGFKEKR